MSKAQLDDNSESAVARIGSTVAGRFLIRRFLGSGGMGAVFEAEHVFMKRRVALKILHADLLLDDEVVARFEREAILAGRLQHPGIVGATDFGRLDDGALYLALEYVAGRTLAEELNRRGPLEPSRAVFIAMQINSALGAAHAAGIVHRDLKPENIMLQEKRAGDPLGDVVRVLDFGIAKLHQPEQGENLTRAGALFGTPEYMPPEQAMGQAADPRSDLYGLGMLLYEMVSGRSAFRAPRIATMLAAQITEPPPALPDHVSAPLRRLIGQLLEKDPRHRPQSSRLLQTEFSRLAADLGGEHSASSLPRLARWTSRMSKGAVWALLLCAFSGGALWWWLAPPERPNVEAPLPEASSETVSQQQLLSDARSGDRDAIFATRRLAEQYQAASAVLSLGPRPRQKPAPDDQGSRLQQVERYLALGRGYSVIRHAPAALSMYRQAVLLDPHVANDPELLLDVRGALAAHDAVEEGLVFVLESLGAHGADMVFDVYQDHLGQPGMTPVVARAMKAVRAKEGLRHATPALSVALRLDRARSCGQFLAVLGEAAQAADQRSLKWLIRLQRTTGCGATGQQDCFACLRAQQSTLDRATLRAQTHRQPAFLTPP